MKAASWRSAAGGIIAVAAVFGCNAILGNESAVFDPTAADATIPNVSGDGSVIQGDGSTGPGDATTPCENVDSNPNHCGACFHDCQGGACVGGRCARR